MNIESLLKSLKEGSSGLDDAVRELEKMLATSSFAKIDYQRETRRGRPETIFCQGKSPEQLEAIFRDFSDAEKRIIGTRASAEQFKYVSKRLPQIKYDPVSRIMRLGENPENRYGAVAVCSGGTADIPVAEEAAQTAEFFGSRVERLYDVGVAGIHRLFDRLDTIRSANAVIAAAGMEGALGGVVAGLVDVPVIALPTSVGYGASFGGIAPLLTMLNSCSEGISVVNIDNGFGAGYLADQINRLAVKGGKSK